MTPTHIEVRKWTTEEFERLVFECKPKVAVFDCDGTLWGGDAGYGFMAWTLEQGLVSRSTHDWIDTRYRDYRAGNVSEVAMCAEMVQLYAGLRDAELRDAAARYVDEFVRKNIFEELFELVARMQKAGVELWAVSSTNRWVIAEGMRDFGIPDERILAAEVRVKDGLITSEIVDVPTDEAKAAALSVQAFPIPMPSSATPFTTWRCWRWRVVPSRSIPLRRLSRPRQRRAGAITGPRPPRAQMQQFMANRPARSEVLRDQNAPAACGIQSQDDIRFTRFTLDVWMRSKQLRRGGRRRPHSALWRLRSSCATGRC